MPSFPGDLDLRELLGSPPVGPQASRITPSTASCQQGGGGCRGSRAEAVGSHSLVSVASLQLGESLRSDLEGSPSELGFQPHRRYRC